jgi:uroporphyrin-3 C-methyltransferase
VNEAPISAAVEPAAAPPAALQPRSDWRWWLAAVLVLAVLAVAALALAWNTQHRVKSMEQELVRRQLDSQGQAAEAHVLAKQAQDVSRDAAAKVALIDARLSEVALQRTQVEELMQALSRSRDENVVADVEASVRVALQQSAITGSAEPLVATLKQADERLARFNQPRLERVRRAVTRDLDRVKAVGVTDISALTIRLDEAVRLIDELPLLAVAEPRKPREGSKDTEAGTPAPASAVASAPDGGWQATAAAYWQAGTSRAWDEVRSLVRVTRIDHPDAVLAAPEQAFFVRENLKLRLLNARLALLSRQFDSAQADLRDVQATLDRYFDRRNKRVIGVNELLRQVMAQARQTGVPRPDETLAALAAAAAAR